MADPDTRWLLDRIGDIQPEGHRETLFSYGMAEATVRRWCEARPGLLERLVAQGAIELHAGEYYLTPLGRSLAAGGA